MQGMKYLVLFVLVLLAGLWLYVRFAPSDPARWPVDPETADAPAGGSFRTRFEMAVPPEAALSAVQAVALETPRTKVFAGAPHDRRITFVTRSRFWGFPDYTTVAATDHSGGSRLTAAPIWGSTAPVSRAGCNRFSSDGGRTAPARGGCPL